MDLNLLPLFVLVAETASFSTAALRLGVQRSSVSRGVAALEQRLRVQLFHRTTRKVVLTSSGAALYAKVMPQLAALQASMKSLPENADELSGPLRISAPDDLGSLVLPEIVSAFVLRHPAVRIDVCITNRLVDLIGEGFDAALRIAGAGTLRGATLMAKKLSELPMHVYAAPSYLARAGAPRTIAEASEHPWIWFRDVKLPKPLPPLKLPPAQSGDTMLYLLNLTRCGGGLCVLPVHATRDDVAAGRLVRVLPRLTIKSGTLYFVYPQSPHVPRKVTALRDFIAAYFATHPLAG